MRIAYFMLPKYICAALLGHAHVCAYERIALSLMRSLNRAHPNRLREKSIYANSVLLDNHVVLISDCDIVNLVAGIRLRSLIRFAGLHEHFLFISFIRNWTTLFSTHGVSTANRLMRGQV